MISFLPFKCVQERCLVEKSIGTERSEHKAEWITCVLTSFPTVFQSYQSAGKMIMKYYMQWNHVYRFRRFLPPAGIEPGTVEQPVQTHIRLLPKEQSDQGLHCLPFHLHLLDA